MFRSLRFYILLFILPLAFIGCGSSDSSSSSDESKVEAAYQSMISAWIDQDWNAACDALTPEGRESLETAWMFAEKELPHSCSGVMKVTVGPDIHGREDFIETMGLRNIVINGNKATTETDNYTTGDGALEYRFKRVDGDWKFEGNYPKDENQSRD